jgi:hypothetical protein
MAMVDEEERWLEENERERRCLALTPQFEGAYFICLSGG